MKPRTRLLSALLMPILTLLVNAAHGQSLPETHELTPEEMDAAFTEEDAAREAALWSDKIIERRPANPLAKMSASADLIIRATVTDQEIVYGGDDTPYTHTTLSIGEVLAGSYSGSMITVVQEGGPAKHEPDNVLILSHTHYFSPGQEELLFLKLNPTSPQAYSRVLIKKRFGVLNGKLFTEDGRGLIYSETDDEPGYTLSWSSDRNPHPRFTDFKIGDHEFSKQFKHRGHENERPGQAVSRRQQQSRPGYQASVDVATFKHALARQGG